MHNIVRRHLSIFITSINWAIFVLIIVFGLRYYFNYDFNGYFWPWVSLISTGAATIIILLKFYVWRRDYLVIADRRIIYHRQKSLFSKVVVEILYTDIVEVSYSQKGLSSSLSNYGDLKIKTMSGSLHFRKVGKPQEIVELINNQREKIKRLNE